MRYCGTCGRAVAEHPRIRAHPRAGATVTGQTRYPRKGHRYTAEPPRYAFDPAKVPHE